MDWVEAIRSAFQAKYQDSGSEGFRSFEEFAAVQDVNGNTCLHVAIQNDNWYFAEQIRAQFYFEKRNYFGLTELELALFLYGTKAREKQMLSVFERCVGYGLGLYGWKQPLSLKSKSASKATKYIKLPTGKVKADFTSIGPEHKLYQFAVEEDYPAPYASFVATEHLQELTAEAKQREIAAEAWMRENFKI